MQYIITIRQELIRSVEMAQVKGLPKHQLEAFLKNGTQNESLAWSPANLTGYAGIYEAENQLLAIDKAANDKNLSPNLLHAEPILPAVKTKCFLVSLKVLRTIIRADTGRIDRCHEEWEHGIVTADTPEEARERAKRYYKDTSTETMSQEIIDSNVKAAAKAAGHYMQFFLE